LQLILLPLPLLKKNDGKRGSEK